MKALFLETFMVYINIYNYTHYVHIFMCTKMGHICLPFISLSPFALLSLPSLPGFLVLGINPRALCMLCNHNTIFPRPTVHFLVKISKFLS